jgi:hypothetical protein
LFRGRINPKIRVLEGDGVFGETKKALARP